MTQQRSTRSNLVAACAVALAAATLIGCNHRTKIPVEQADHGDTPQGNLKNVMRRLQFALDRAKPVPGSGVTSVRKCNYELNEPADEGGEYTATVTIAKTVTVIAKPAKHKDKDPPTGGQPQLQPISSEATAPTTAAETTTYKLAYRNHRWELIEPAQADLPETEGICFHYALSDG